MRFNGSDWNILNIYLKTKDSYLDNLYTTYIKPTLLDYGIFESMHSTMGSLTTWVIGTVPYFTPKLNVIFALTTAFKFLCLIALLIFIRGGVPRYRYDFLTKIGWIKFLSLVLAVFLTSLLFTFLM